MSEIEWPNPGVGSLSRMRVLDLSQQLPGPYATGLLRACGASVIKVEPPAGDVAAALDPPMYAAINTGKRVVRLNLKKPADRDVALAMAGEADVVVESSRPGVSARLGVGPEEICAINPASIYCSISGYGQQGPLAYAPAHDMNIQAVAGALVPETDSGRIGVPWTDLATGSIAALAISDAWHQGRPGLLDIAMLDAAMAWAGIKQTALTVEPTYGTFAAKDGVVTIAMLEDASWLRLCEAFGWDDLAADPELGQYLARREQAGRIRGRLLQEFQQRRKADILSISERYDLGIVAVGDENEDIIQQRKARADGRSMAVPSIPRPRPYKSSQ